MVVTFLKDMHAAGLPFVVLRNLDEILGESAGSLKDVDILTSKEGLADLISFFRERGCFYQKRYNHYGFTKVDGQGTAFDVQVGEVRECNLPLLSWSEVQADISIEYGIPVLNSGYSIVHLILHCLLNKKYFKASYRETIATLMEDATCRCVLKERLERVFPGRMAGRVFDAIENKDYDSLENRLLFYIMMHIMRRPWALGPFVVYVVAEIQRRYFGRYGKVIAFIGLDGAGKTTVAEEMVKTLGSHGFQAQYMYMGKKRGHVLPMHAIAKQMGMSKYEEKKKEPGVLYKLARDSMYMLDMLFRYWLHIFPQLLKGRYVICDRYAYSLYLDRNQTFVSRCVLRCLYPRPLLLFFIDVPEEEIIRRKDEYDSQERQRQLDRWRLVVARFNGKVLVSENLAAMTCKVMQRLSDVLG